MTESSKIIEAIHFLLSRIGKSDKIKIVKLIYLVDKYHLIRYGRTLTNDTYFAMEYGPVGSTVKDVLSFNDLTLSKKELEYAETLLEKIDNNTFQVKKEAKEVDYEMLSETDIEALEAIIKKLGSMATWDLMNLTHQYPEWYRHEDLFKNKRAKRIQIDSMELLSTLENDPIGMDEEHISESEKILTGVYD